MIAIRPNIYKVHLTLLIFILISELISGQVIIKGHILNKTGDGLPRISILIYEPANKAIISFAVSDENGYFVTKVNSNSDSLIIKISSINHQDETRYISNASQIQQFVLQDEIKQLKGISVIAAPIIKHGDTLSYMVNSFAKNEDKVIEDVLRRMPGIEISDNGEILYQGLHINKFYVEGLDLMEGRYALINKNLPKESVTVVEILENHQPVRLIQDKVETQEAAINLKLNRGITTTGTAKSGVGWSPFLWDLNITPMTFTKKYQFVTSLQSNNTGDDVSQQLHIYTYEELKNSIETPIDQKKMLNVITPSTPDIKPERYLDNKVMLLNFNGLQHLNEDYTLRTNLYYTSDEQAFKASMMRTMFMPEDTLKLSEKYDNTLSINNLYAKFNINRNVKKNYLNDDVKIQYSWDKQVGSIYSEGRKIEQTLRNPLQSISNDLNSLTPIGNYIWEFRSHISYNQIPQRLSIFPGQFKEILNDSMPYTLVNQNADMKRFYTDNSGGLVFGFKRITFSPRIGLNYYQQTLNSNISLELHDNETKLDSKFSNDIIINHLQGYINTNIEYRLSKLTLSGGFKLKTHDLKINDNRQINYQDVTKWLSEGWISTNYKINSFWRVYNFWGYNEQLGNIDDTYSGYILKNYRSLCQNIIPISTTSSQTVTSRIEYRNQIISFFNTLSYVFSISHSSNTTSNLLNADGSAIVTNHYLGQTSRSHFLQFYSSKYFSTAKTTISLNVKLIQQDGTSLVNNDSFTTRNTLICMNPNLSIHFTPWMNVEYFVETYKIITSINEVQKSKISLFKHNVGFFFFPSKNQLFNLSTEYYRHNEANNLFVDLMYRYTFSKQRVDVEVKCNNIFNSNSYTSFHTDTYSVWETTYSLRPFKVILSVKFNF